MIKIFEEYNKKPKIGDFVLMKYNNSSILLKDLADFINNNIGIIVHIDTYNIYIEYNKIPIKIQRFFDKNRFVNSIMMFGDDIVDFSKTKQELELKISTNKYNL